ncbi:MAG: nucleotidyltransferase family protein [Bacteroidota bacterium]
MNWLYLTAETTFEEAVKLLDENGNGFLPVIDQAEKLLGIITDGDLRRAILRKSMNLKDVINYSPMVAKEGTPRGVIKRQLIEIHRKQMPVVSTSGKLVEVVLLNEFEKGIRPNWVVIMAGGLGSRLGNLTKTIPKPMLEVGDKPILEHIIDNFKEYGFAKFILCVNYKAEVIEEYFGDGSKFGINIVYTKEKKRLGTAGALSLIDIQIQDPFFITNGDIITSLNFEDLLEFHLLNKAKATMCVKKFEYQVPFACVQSDTKSNILSLVEKPTYNYHINAGLYMINPEILHHVPKDTFYDMPMLFDDLLENGENLKVFRMEDYWLDIGRPHDYKKINDDLNFSPLRS